MDFSGKKFKASFISDAERSVRRFKRSSDESLQVDCNISSKRPYQEHATSLMTKNKKMKVQPSDLSWSGSVNKKEWKKVSPNKKTWKERRLAAKNRTTPLKKNNDSRVLRGVYANVGLLSGLDEFGLDELFETKQAQSADFIFFSEVKLEEGNNWVDRERSGWTKYEYLREEEAEGGIILYVREDQGLNHYDWAGLPGDLSDKHKSERAWHIFTDGDFITAICGVYWRCEGPHQVKNQSLVAKIKEESLHWENKGARVIACGDFNAHVGSVGEYGIADNPHSINRNGELLTDLLNTTNMVLGNNLKNEDGTNICKGGPFTFFNSRGNCSIVDYVTISRNHSSSLVSMDIDSTGDGVKLDHAIVTFELAYDRAPPPKKQKLTRTWVFNENGDTTLLGENLNKICKRKPDFKSLSVQAQGAFLTKSIVDAAKSSGSLVFQTRERLMSRKSALPSPLRKIIKDRQDAQAELRQFAISSHQKIKGDSLSQEEQLRFNIILKNYQSTSDIESIAKAQYKCFSRKKVKILCESRGKKGLRKFWKYVTGGRKNHTKIDVVQREDGSRTTDPKSMSEELEKHYCKVFNAVPEKDDPMDNNLSNEEIEKLGNPPNSLNQDQYEAVASNFTMDELKDAIKKLKAAKAPGFDKIHNEFFSNLADESLDYILHFFNNMLKHEETYNPWKQGNVKLIHKKNDKSKLGNYRPLTLTSCFHKLFTRILNTRLRRMSEEARLLPEEQQGFREGREPGDNVFVLMTLLEKSKYMKKHLHMSFIDITKAYDSVCRKRLWFKMSQMNFPPKFINILKHMYKDDSIETEMGSIKTSKVYPRRGLRQA